MSFLNDALGFNIYRAELLLHREFLKALNHYKMTPEQWFVISNLLNSDIPLNQRELVQRTLKDKHTISRIIQRLARDGWIEIMSDKSDGRLTLIGPTSKGKELKTDIPKKLSKHFAPIFHNFSADEMNTFMLLLQKLRRILGD
jgi:DNA-binding MarR family transcriptional regulator